MIQIKIFLFCLSMVLLPKIAAQTNAPEQDDIEITGKCSSSEIEVAFKKVGIYYQCATKNLIDCTRVAEVKTNGTNVPTTIKSLKLKPVILRVDVEKLIGKEYDSYTLDCTTSSVVKSIATGKIEVKHTKNPKHEKTIHKSGNEHITVTFEDKDGKALSAVVLGEAITMKMEADSGNFKMLRVTNCSASTGKQKVQFYPDKDKKLKIKYKEDISSSLTFESFRLVSQKGDELTFSCQVLLCTDKSKCSLPEKKAGQQPASPILYEESQGVKSENVGGVLAVYLPQYQAFSSAVKVSSYAKGFLLTVGASLLQRQLV